MILFCMLLAFEKFCGKLQKYVKAVSACGLRPYLIDVHSFGRRIKICENVQKIPIKKLTQRPKYCNINKLMLLHRGVAQFGSAHGLGPWGREFESLHPDQTKAGIGYGPLAQLVRAVGS